MADRQKKSILVPVIIGIALASSALSFGPQGIRAIINWYNSPPVLSDAGQKLYKLLDDDGKWSLDDNPMYRDDTVIHDNGIWLTNLKSSEVSIHYKKEKKTDFFTSWDKSYIRKKANALLLELKEKEVIKAKEELLQVLDK